MVREQNHAPDLSARPWVALPPETAQLLRPGVPGVVDEVIAAIRAQVPAYARPLEGAFGQAIRTGVQQALEQFVAMAGRPEEDRSDMRQLYVNLGRGEAREGRSMEALLAAYRIGARVAWRRVAETARTAQLDAVTLALLAEAIFAYIDELSAASAEGFAREQAAEAGELERRRRRLLRLLVASPAPEPPAVEEAARDARWELPASLAALVWRGSPRWLAARLPAGAIVGPLDELWCALVPDPAAPGRRRELAAAAAEQRAALGTPVAWPETLLSARRAVAAHRLAEEGRIASRGLVVADDHLAALIVHGDDALLADLARRRLAPLDGETASSRARLTETLAAWLAHQGSVPAIAAALHVHPQTVRYRLGRLRDRFGDELDDPRARFELGLCLVGVRES